MLPPGDCGHRSRDTRWQSGPARAMPGALGLVVGATAAAIPERRQATVAPPLGTTFAFARRLGALAKLAKCVRQAGVRGL